MLTALLLAARITVPVGPTALIARHLEAIERAGWAVVVPGDLYHAHLLLSPDVAGRDRFRTSEELFGASVAVLYHSDEMLIRWRLDDGELPTARKRPRSILGYPDGSIAPAVSLLDNPERDAVHYMWHGTIHSDDLAHALPERFLERRDWPVGQCTVNLIVDIFRRSDGTLQLTMDCARR